MYEQPPPKSQFAPGFASEKARWVMFAGIVVAVVGGLHERDRVTLGIGCVIVLAGSAVDILARRGSSQFKYALIALVVAGGWLIWSNPHEAWNLMNSLASHASSFIGGKR